MEIKIQIPEIAEMLKKELDDYFKESFTIYDPATDRNILLQAETQEVTNKTQGDETYTVYKVKLNMNLTQEQIISLKHKLIDLGHYLIIGMGLPINEGANPELFDTIYLIPIINS